VNRRIAGLVKQRRKRAQKRVDIRAGRIVSMQQLVNGTHQHHHEVEPTVIEVEPLPTHELVYKINGNMIARGTEYAMRKERAKLGADYSVRKIKVAV